MNIRRFSAARRWNSTSLGSPVKIRDLKRLRRILLGIIAAVLLAVGLNYYETWRQMAGLTRRTPRMLGEEMLRSAEAIEYSDYRSGVIQFRVRAEKLLETREGVSILEGLDAEDYDPDGRVRNRIRSRKGEYDRAKKRILFSDDVQVRLGNEAELKTGSLHYDLAEYAGYTEDLVELRTRNASGTCRGLRYSGRDKSLELVSDVDFYFVPPPPVDGSQPPDKPMRVQARTGHYDERVAEIRFGGGVRIEAANGDLSGEEVTARLDPARKRLASLACEGNAVYQSGAGQEAGTLSGRRIVVSMSPGTGIAEQIHVEREARFRALVQGQGQELAAEEILLELGGPGRGPRRMTGKRRVEYSLRRASASTVAAGELLEASFRAGETGLRDLRMSGNARLRVDDFGRGSREELAASEIRAVFKEEAAESGLRDLTAKGSVRWTSRPGTGKEGGGRTGGYSMNADSLHLLYADRGEFLQSGRADGGVSMRDLPEEHGTDPSIRSLRCDRVQFAFFPQINRMNLFEGQGRVEGQIQPKTHAGAQGNVAGYRTSSSAIRILFDEKSGEVASASQWGSFVYRDSERTVTAGRAEYDAASERLMLRESPAITDADGITRGNYFEYGRRDGLLHARGRVQSILRAGSGRSGGLGGTHTGEEGQILITASEMHYWLEESRALYSGGIKLLSGDGQLQAASLAVVGAGDEIEADGGIHHILFPQGNTLGSGGDWKGTRRETGEGKEPLTIRSATLRYQRSANALHYGGGVALESAHARIVSQELEAVLDPEGREIQFAAARGKLRIDQGGREARGDEALYYPAEGKFIVAGNPAAIRDPVRGDSVARRLTFYTSDDRILLENRP